MKKLFALALTICLMLTALCIPAFAAEPPAEGVVLRVSGLLSDGNLVTYEDHKDMETGWNAAIDLALNTETLKEKGFKRVVVDLYADWTAKDEDFGDDSDGFDEGAIVFPEDVCVTLNLNGHTIDRDLNEWEYDGSVIFIGEDADVIINDGTITGGYSCDSAGGIQIAGYATVVLNNVNVKGNWVEDEDGGGIAVFNHAKLTMNGGSICDNMADEGWFVGFNATDYVRGAGIYADDATVVLEGVNIQNNQFKGYGRDPLGAVIYANYTEVIMNNCTVTGNGIEDEAQGFVTPNAILYGRAGCMFTITNTTFTNNGASGFATEKSYYPSLFTMHSYSPLNLDNCTFTGNKAVYLFVGRPDFSIYNCTFTDNNSNILDLADFYSGHKLSFTNCTFNNNSNTTREKKDTFHFYYSDDEDLDLTFTDCDLGNSTFNYKEYAKFVDQDVTLTDQPVDITIQPLETVPEEFIPEETTPVEVIPEETTPEDVTPPLEGSVISAGSTSTALALLALGVSVASLAATIALNKKKSSANSK